MSPEDQDAITRSIANLWTLNAIVLSAVMRGLQAEGALSNAAVEGILQSIDRFVDTLDGPDDQEYATRMLASVRTVLAQAVPRTPPDGS